jgi:hypothetical protein
MTISLVEASGRSLGEFACVCAAEYGQQLGALRWLQHNGCKCDKCTYSLHLMVGISPYFNGREQVVVDGVVIHVRLELLVGISSPFTGRVQMIVTGIVIHVPE